MFHPRETRRPDPDTPAAATAPAAIAAWRRMRRLTGVLLAAWFAISFLSVWFARDLEFRFFGWPFGFWMAAQGALVFYVVLVAGYAWAANRIERETGTGAPDA